MRASETMTSTSLTACLSVKGSPFSRQKPDSCTKEIHFTHLLYKLFEQKQL